MNDRRRHAQGGRSTPVASALLGGLALVFTLWPGTMWSAPVRAPAAGSIVVPGTLRGSVVDSRTGAPIVGAEIHLVLAETRTFVGMGGRFTFGDLDVRGPDTIVVRHIQYDSLRLAIESDDLGPLDLELHLDTKPIPIEGLEVLAVRSEAQRVADLYDGRVWAREEFDSFIPSAESAVDPLRWAPGVSQVLEGANGERCVVIRVRRGCAATYVNNMPVPTNHLVTLPTDIIDSYVIFGPIEGEFMYGLAGSSGVVLIFTKR